MPTGCGSIIAMDTMENGVTDNMYQKSGLDHLILIYNAPWEYADLLLNGDPEAYLKNMIE